VGARDDGGAGALYVVATPIGNLEDLSARALRVLGSVALIAAEDTRVTRKLLARHDLHTPLTPCHAHTGAGKVEGLAQRLAAGEDLALVSDAGTPGISDPGGELVRAALAVGARVIPIPGPSAVTAALSAGGLEAGRFVFLGFLPRTRGERLRLLEPLAPLPLTLVVYEAPGRVAGTLAWLAETLGDRDAVVAREVSKQFEEFARGPLTTLATRYADTPPRGECVLLVAGADPAAPPAPKADPAEVLRELLGAGVSVRDAARRAAEVTGLPRKQLYEQALALTRP
jgi:16S rRNA (cytidine1402-2'-O)-methyltransferase